MSDEKPQMQQLGVGPPLDPNEKKEPTKDDDNGSDVGVPVLEHLKNAPTEEEKINSLITEVANAPFFHGSIGSEDLPESLKENGDFLLRTPIESNAASKVITAVYWNGKIHEFPIHLFKDDGITKVYFYQTFVKASIKELIMEYMMTSMPVEGEIVLKKPVPRSKWQLPPNSLSLEEKLGEGAFGAVFKGKLREGISERMVAVKVTKECDENRKNELLLEARLMRHFQNPYVVKFHGLVVDQDKVMLVMELVVGGSLDNYLKKNKEISVFDKRNFCLDVARGLSYLHEQHFLHRDVASRNCLIDRNTKSVKLSDFGMTKQGETYKIQATERTPIRWQAPEVLKTAMYSKMCDVYSYGMVMYEIFSGGKVPFEGIDNKIIRQNIHVKTYRPEIADEWPVEIKAIMAFCWVANPARRPSMSAIVGLLKDYTKNPKRNNGSKELVPVARPIKFNNPNNPKHSIKEISGLKKTTKKLSGVLNSTRKKKPSLSDKKTQ